MTFHLLRPLLALVMLAACLPPIACPAADPPRPSLWIDLLEGEPAPYETVLNDLAKARVIYVGERHTLVRHHATQTRIVADLLARKVPLAVAFESLNAADQPAIDRFNRGEIDFSQLAEAIHWGRQWSNYEQYRPILEAAQKGRAPVVGLNVSSDLVRQVFRGGGVAKLDKDSRQKLPAEMRLNDPLYEKLLGMQMMVHMAASPERLRPMIEAQIVRDECMAEALAKFLATEAGRGRTAVVICGAGHVAYGLGAAERVGRRMPGAIQRIVLLSESGDVRLSKEEMAAARPIDITHQQLREIDRPIGDYLEAVVPSNER